MERTLYIPKTWDLPEAIRRRLGESVGKQRLMHEDGHLLLLLHQAPRAEDDEVRTAVVVWRNPAGEWKSAPVGGGVTGLEAHVASYRTAIHCLDEEVESAKSARQYFDVMRTMHPLQRSTRHLFQVLQATREAIPDETRIINLRDQAADLERAIELIAADAKSGMEFSLAEAASQQAQAAEVANQEARRLNRLAAFFFPLATLVAVFGMNPPELVWRTPGFYMVLAAGVVLGFIVHALVAAGRRKDS
jgi:hypothetical protein